MGVVTSKIARIAHGIVKVLCIMEARLLLQARDSRCIAITIIRTYSYT